MSNGYRMVVDMVRKYRDTTGGYPKLILVGWKTGITLVERWLLQLKYGVRVKLVRTAPLATVYVR